MKTAANLHTAEQRGARPRVVIAESDGDLRHLLEIMLDAGGFEAVPVSDGGAALEVLSNGGGECLVTALGDIDSAALCGALRGRERSASLPIVVFTAADPDERRLTALGETRELRVLSKPDDLDAIATALREMIG